MESQLHQQLRETIAKSQSIGIIVGKNPNIDQMAAGLALYLSLTHLGKNVSIASPTEPIVEISNLVGIDKVRRALAADGGDLTVSFPYREGEIDKVSYTLQDGLLNIVVKAGEKGLQFQEKDIVFKRSGKNLNLIFVIGIPRLTDVETILTPNQLKDAAIINIDNKPDNQGYGDIPVVSPKASSLSEIIADLLTLMDPDTMVDVDVAQNLLSGIVNATNDFQDVKTSAIAFEMAGILMRKGATRPRREFRPQMPERRQGFVPQPRSQHPQQRIQREQRAPQSQGQVTQPAQPVGQHAQPVNSYNNQVQSQPVQQQQPAAQPQPTAPQQPTQPVQAPQQREEQAKEAPSDWLTPKVYKGSTIV